MKDSLTQVLPASSQTGYIKTLIALLLFGLLSGPAWGTPDGATQSSSISLAANGAYLFTVNHEANSVTVFSVDGGYGTLTKLDELPVGREPDCVAISDGQQVYVTNSGSGTVSFIEWDVNRFRVTKEIAVGAEPRACALTPSGNLLYVANYSEGTLSVIDTASKSVIDTVQLGGNPGAISVTNDKVFVTQFFAKLIPSGPGEGFNNGKEGIVQVFPVGHHDQITEITLSPLADSGFTADRTNLCPQTALPQILANSTFCPNLSAPKGSDLVTKVPQAVYPNQLKSVLICGGKLYLPNIGAQPEPPVAFNTNVQALVYVVDTAKLAERTDLHINLNAQIKAEKQPDNPTTSLARLFGNDVVAIDADNRCENFLILSRGGNYAIKAWLGTDGKLSIGAPDKVVRFQTGNIPTGVVVDRKGKRAYVNNEVNMSVSVLDLDANTVIARDVPASTPPQPGSHDHARLMGKLVFFTALGVPDNGLVGTPLRDIIPLQFRGKQSDNAWSSCASCHPDGLADGVTWIFADGPRQTIPLDGLYSKINGAHDVRILNWSAVRDSVTDFNNNSRNVQCGAGFAGGDPPKACNPASPGGAPNPNIFDHGISQGASEALDLETLWAQTVRSLNTPKPGVADLSVAVKLFGDNCASCHGGAKWTKSQVLYLNNPALDKAAAAGGTPRDPGVTLKANQIVAYADTKVDANPLKFLENVGTFNAANPIEVRQNGLAPLGADGFNVPSLLGVGSSAPYFHNGAAQTLEDVFVLHGLGSGTIQSTFDASERAALLAFLRSIDGRTSLFRSEADTFHEPVP